MNPKYRFSGQSLIEFALLIPIILALLMGFFDLGRALIYYSSLSNAVREGTRTGIVTNFSKYDTDTTIKTNIDGALKDKVFQYAFGLNNTSVPLLAENIEILPITNKDNNEFYKELQITATYCFVPITPGIISIVGDNCPGDTRGLTLTAKSKMLFEPGFNYKK